MFFIMGFQSILMGLIAELLARTYTNPSEADLHASKSDQYLRRKKQAPLIFGMQILILNSEYPPIGGGAGNASAYCRPVRRMGHTVTVVTLPVGALPHREVKGA